MLVPSSSSLLGPQPTAATGEAIGCHDSPEAVGLSTYGESELEGNDLKSAQAPPHDQTTGEPPVGDTARHPDSRGGSPQDLERIRMASILRGVGPNEFGGRDQPPAVLGQEVADSWQVTREHLRGTVEIAVFTQTGGSRISPQRPRPF